MRLPSCQDVTDHASRHLDGEGGWRTRLGVALHLLICVHCRRYLAQLRAALGVLRRLPAEPSDAAAVDGIVAAMKRARPS